MKWKYWFCGLFAFSSLVAQDPLDTKETFPAILEPIQHAVILPTINARVLSIPFKLGDSFQKGDILITFENDQIVATLKKTEASLKKAKEDYRVKKDLAADRLVSILELLEADAEVATAEADYATAKQLFSESQIRAPYGGKIANVSIQLFEIPSRDKPVLEIFNDQTLIVNLLVPSRYLKSIHHNQPIYVYIKDTQEIVQAVIKRISPVVNAASGTIKIEAELNNSNGHLKSGMSSLAAFNRTAFVEPDGSIDEILEEMKKRN